MAYTKKDWQNGEVISEEALDNIETGVDEATKSNTSQDSKISALESKVTALEGKTKNASTSAPGIVKQCTKVAEAAGENVTKAEFKALLDALIAAGIMASA